ncbi:hypothetical protein, partial [Desulfobaculum sp.]
FPRSTVQTPAAVKIRPQHAAASRHFRPRPCPRIAKQPKRRTRRISGPHAHMPIFISLHRPICHFCQNTKKCATPHRHALHRIDALGKSDYSLEFATF